MPRPPRRRLLASLLAAAAGLPVPGLTQVAGGSRRIAYLASGTAKSGDALYRTLNTSLRAFGWAEGTNLIIDSRYPESDPQRVLTSTRELLDLKPDIFVSSVDVYARPAAEATKLLPIVFVLGFDPVGLGLVQSLARPGRNVTGFAILNYELNAKRLALFKEALPRMDKVGVLYRDGDPGSQPGLDSLAKAGQAMGITIVPMAIRTPEDISAAIERAARSGLRGVMNVPEPLFFQMRKLIADLCIEHHLAASFGAAEYAVAGTLIGYGVDFAAMYQRAAGLIDRILRGASPATIPVEMANSYELVLNLKTARAINIDVPKSLLLQATRVIE